MSDKKLKIIPEAQGAKPPKVEYFDTPPLMISVEALAKAFRNANLPNPPVDMWKKHQSLDFYLGMFASMRICIMGALNILANPAIDPKNFINEMQFLNGQLANIIEEKNKSRIITSPTD